MTLGLELAFLLVGHDPDRDVPPVPLPLIMYATVQIASRIDLCGVPMAFKMLVVN